MNRVINVGCTHKRYLDFFWHSMRLFRCRRTFSNQNAICCFYWNDVSLWIRNRSTWRINTSLWILKMLTWTNARSVAHVTRNFLSIDRKLSRCSSEIESIQANSFQRVSFNSSSLSSFVRRSASTGIGTKYDEKMAMNYHILLRRASYSRSENCQPS